ncbi:MAG: molybdopterin molybdotransferase MoeA [Acidobacteria bacterium]|nr:molybdopterin molybdotransferase MoeA [Acidobacteriota bacterium]
MKKAIKARTGMRPFGKLAPYAAALDTALGLCRPVREAESLPLGAAAGRVVHDDVRASADVPATDRAAMDGYAVLAADLADLEDSDSPVELEVVGRVLAGNLDETALHNGQCWEVATGAQLPRGADAVVPVEQTTSEGGRVVILQAVASGVHVSERGEDLRQGDVIVAAGDVLMPSAAAALASIGMSAVDVRRRPEVLLVPTGDELVALDRVLEPGQVYDSNSVALQALLEANGARVRLTPIVRDDPAELLDGLGDGEVDLVVTLGGTSVGRHDLVLDVVEQMGEVLIHGVAIKPGKPVLVARVGETPVLGLPGFPTSCLFTGYLFAEPMVRTLAGLPLSHRRRAEGVLTETVNSPAGKRQFLSVQLRAGKASPVYRASSTITSMSRANGWIEIVEQATEVRAGSRVEVTFF